MLSANMPNISLFIDWVHRGKLEINSKGNFRDFRYLTNVHQAFRGLKNLSLVNIFTLALLKPCKLVPTKISVGGGWQSEQIRSHWVSRLDSQLERVKIKNFRKMQDTVIFLVLKYLKRHAFNVNKLVL